MSLITPELFPEVADSVTCNGLGDCVSLLREPDAANPHVRFDERGVETEAWRSEEHTSELQSHLNIVCRLLLEKKHDSTCALKGGGPQRELNPSVNWFAP